MKRTLLALAFVLTTGCQDGANDPTTPATPTMTIAPENVFDTLPEGIQQVSSGLSIPTTPQSVRFVDDATWTDGTSNYHVGGSAVLNTDGAVYIEGIGDSGPKA